MDGRVANPIAVDFGHPPELIERSAQAPRVCLAGGASKRPAVRKRMHRNARHGGKKTRAADAKGPCDPLDHQKPQPRTSSRSCPGVACACARRASAPQLAGTLALNSAYDVHAVLKLLDRGCSPELAARILAPTEHEPRSC
jgi:hypothetical protein